MFKVYLSLGFEHILDWKAIDHIAFIAVMCSIYVLKDWKKVFYLATAFTLGHSVTLALAALQIIKIDANLVESLIPVTIIIAAIYNGFLYQKRSHHLGLYIMVSFFGLIHGLGFSNYFSSFLIQEESIILPLLYFNIGVELGQFIIILALLLLSSACIKYMEISKKNWTMFLAGIGFGIALDILIQGIG